MINQVKKVTELLRIEDTNIEIDNQRCTFPTAQVYPNQDGRIIITANTPSLVRFALASLIIHEKAHIEFMKDHPNYEGDQHLHPDFKRIENHFLQRLDKKILEEHD